MKTISEIIHGKAAITAETALQLERVLGVPASLWQNLEANYRLRLAERGETGSLASHAPWARKFPIKELVERGCFDEASNDADLVKKVMKFFGVGTVSGWNASFGEMELLYRRSPAFTAARENMTTWIRLGGIEGGALGCAPFDRARFKSVLLECRGLTTHSFPDVQAKLVELCASAGVAVVFVPELPKTHVSGIARWLTKDKAHCDIYHATDSKYAWSDAPAGTGNSGRWKSPVLISRLHISAMRSVFSMARASSGKMRYISSAFLR